MLVEGNLSLNSLDFERAAASSSGLKSVLIWFSSLLFDVLASSDRSILVVRGGDGKADGDNFSEGGVCDREVLNSNDLSFLVVRVAFRTCERDFCKKEVLILNDRSTLVVRGVRGGAVGADAWGRGVCERAVWSEVVNGN